MYDSIINQEGDLLIVHFSDSVDRRQSEQCYELVESIIQGAKPGFTVITDLGRLNHMDFECAEYISAIMDLCNKAQVAHVYRVIPNPEIDIGWNIMSKFHYNADTVQIQTFPSFYQAMKTMLVKKPLSVAARS